MSWFGWSLFRINGQSMAPALAHGDFAVGRRCADYAPGHIVLVEHQHYGRIVKSIQRVLGDGRVLLAGLSPLSTSTADLGPVEPGQIISRVTWRVSPSGVTRLDRHP